MSGARAAARPGPVAPRRRRAVLAGVGVGAAAIVVTLVVVLGGGGEPGPEAGPGPSASVEPSPQTSPSGAAEPEPGTADPAVPVPAETEPGPELGPELGPETDPEVPDANPEPQPSLGPDGGAALPPLGTAPPEVVTLDAPAPVAGGAQARVVSVEEITAEASGIGEIGGPAMLVTLEVLNSGTDPVALGAFSVSAYLGDDAVPASPVTSDERHVPLTGQLAGAATARGSYVFSLRGDPGGLVSISVLSATDSPQVVFQGQRPGSVG